jgi:hypothetical protein
MAEIDLLENRFIEQATRTGIGGLFETMCRQRMYRLLRHSTLTGLLGFHLVYEFGGSEEDGIAVGAAGFWHDGGKLSEECVEMTQQTDTWDDATRAAFGAGHTREGGKRADRDCRNLPKYPTVRSTVVHGAYHHHGSFEAYDRQAGFIRPPMPTFILPRLQVLKLSDITESSTDTLRGYTRDRVDETVPAQRIYRTVERAVGAQTRIMGAVALEEAVPRALEIVQTLRDREAENLTFKRSA